MTNTEIKEKMIQALYNRGEYIRQVDDVEYQTRCPFCGDSDKNLRTGHLYVRIGLNDNFPMVYNCFKCPASGIIDQNFLTVMGIDNIDLKSNIFTLNKTSDNISSHKFIYGEEDISFPYELPKAIKGEKTRYIENRLGISLTDEDLQKMKVITSLREFLEKNEIEKLTCEKGIFDVMERYYVGFLSFGNTHVLLRDITEKSKYAWLKYPITKKSKEARIFYCMESAIDVFSKEPITINLAEGVMDIISSYYNLDYNGFNTLSFAVLGKQYDAIIRKLIMMGYIGDNVTINVFSDNDEAYNRKNKTPTDIEYFKKIFRKSKYLFKEVNIFYNIIGKDIGVPKEKIVLKKEKL